MFLEFGCLAIVLWVEGTGYSCIQLRQPRAVELGGVICVDGVFSTKLLSGWDEHPAETLFTLNKVTAVWRLTRYPQVANHRHGRGHITVGFPWS